MQNADRGAFQFAAKGAKARPFSGWSPALFAPPPFHMTFVSTIGVVQRSNSTGDEFFLFFFFLIFLVFSSFFFLPCYCISLLFFWCSWSWLCLPIIMIIGRLIVSHIPDIFWSIAAQFLRFGLIYFICFVLYFFSFLFFYIISFWSSALQFVFFVALQLRLDSLDSLSSPLIG